MALWFSGASSVAAPREYQRGEPPTGKAHPAVHQSHLDTATLQPTFGSRAHGKRRTEPGDSWTTGDQVAQLMFSSSDATNVVKPAAQPTPRHAHLREYVSHLCADLQPQEAPRAQGVKVFKTPPRTAASSATPTPPASMNQSADSATVFLSSPAVCKTPAPFASDLNNDPAVPYVGMRRKITEPRVNNTTDGDAFVLKRSRTPPAGAKYKETSSEGFGVLLASSLKSRANPQMVPSSRYGKLAAQKAEEAILEQRRSQESMVQRAIHEKSMRAYEEEKRRMAEHQQPQRSTGRGRCSTPPPSVCVPFALNYPAPRDIVGKRLSAVHSPRRWVR